MCVSKSDSLMNFLRRGLGVTKRDIESDCVIKGRHFLRDVSDLIAKCPQIIEPEFFVSEFYRAFIWLDESQQQRKQGRLATPGNPDNNGLFIRRDMK